MTLQDSGEKSFLYHRFQSTDNDLSPLHKNTTKIKKCEKVLGLELGSPVFDSDSCEDDMEFVVEPLVSPSSSGEEDGGEGVSDPPLFLHVSLSLHDSDRQQFPQPQQQGRRGTAQYGLLTTCISEETVTI